MAPCTPEAVDRRPPAPSSTTIVFLLLVVLLAVSGVFVGDWLWRIVMRPAAGEFVPWWWLVWPPAVTLALMAVLVWSEPERTIRRDHLERLTPESPAAVRLAELAVAAGVHSQPPVFHNPRDKVVTARTLGRPGAYAVLVTPAMQGMVRRRPRVFDAVIDHELAHISCGDVAMAHFAGSAAAVALGVLALPLVAQLVLGDMDASLLPQHLLGTGSLALAVFAGRAYLLRVREHYADVRATPTTDAAEAMIASLSSARSMPRVGAGSARPSLFAVHPEVGQRITVLAQPFRLARPSVVPGALAGFVAGSCVPSVWYLLSSAPNGNPVIASNVASALLLGAMAAVLGCDAVRAAGYAGPGHHSLVPAFLAVLGALAFGTLGSFADASSSAADLARVLLLGAAAASVVLLLHEVLSAGLRPATGAGVVAWVLAASLISALCVIAWWPVASAVGQADPSAIDASVWLLWNGVVTPVGLAVVAVLAIWLARTPRLDWVVVAAGGGLMGALATTATTAVRCWVGDAAHSEPATLALVAQCFGLTTVAAVMTAGLVAASRGAPAGYLASMFCTIVGFAGFVAVLRAWGGDITTIGMAEELLRWLVPAGLLAVPVAALAGQVHRPAVAASRRVIGWALVGAAISAVALAALVTTVAVPAVLHQHVDASQVLRVYVTQELPTLIRLRNSAWSIASSTAGTPAEAEQIRSAALPLYRAAHVRANDVAEDLRLASDPRAAELSQAYLAVVVAEEHAWAKRAVALETADAGAAEESTVAFSVASNNLSRFNAAYTSAVESIK